MLSNAAGDIYRRNRRWGVPGADNLGMRQFAGMQRSAAVAPNVAALNSSRMMNSRGGSPLAQVGMALQGNPIRFYEDGSSTVGGQGMPNTPYFQQMMRPPLPVASTRAKQYLASQQTARPRRRTTPYL